jgi:Major Facilitator Superfamily
MFPSQSQRSSSAKRSASRKSGSQHEAVDSKICSRSSSVTRPSHETSDQPKHEESNEPDADAIQEAAAADDNANPSEGEKRDEGAPKGSEPLRGFALWSATAGLVCAVFVVQLNTEIVATAIPSITNYFNSITDIGYYGSAFMLANCVLQPLAGRIYTHQSLKGSFLGFLLVFEIGNLICGLATSSDMLIGGRVISGAGSAGVVNGCLAITAHIAPIEKRPILVAMIANVSRIGVIFGPLLGGVLSEKVSWR